jgi:hypothetical protein
LSKYDNLVPVLKIRVNHSRTSVFSENPLTPQGRKDWT